MKTFDEVMKLTRNISSETAFSDAEAKLYYDCLVERAHARKVVGARPEFVEIGLQFGRSSSIALQVADDYGCVFTGVDPFIQPPEAFAQWVTMAQQFKCTKILYHCLSEEIGNVFCADMGVDVILIDGCHDEEVVAEDLKVASVLLRSGGYILCHDFGRESLPGVFKAVGDFLAVNNKSFRLHSHVDTLGVIRRIQ